MLSPSVTSQLIRQIADTSTVSEVDRRRAARSRLEQLSEREHEVAVAVGTGKANAEIAADLYLSVATVKAPSRTSSRSSTRATGCRSPSAFTTPASA